MKKKKNIDGCCATCKYGIMTMTSTLSVVICERVGKAFIGDDCCIHYEKQEGKDLSKPPKRVAPNTKGAAS